MKLLFAAVAVASAERSVLTKSESEKAAGQGSCQNNGNCYTAGRDDSYFVNSPQGGCYCDAACHTQFNDCCADMLYQCYNGEDDLCPSTKCYTQSDVWSPGQAITCDMDNSDCLKNTCSMSGMSVELDVALFHTNDENPKSFVDQLIDGTRNLAIDGLNLSSNHWSASGDIITVSLDYASDGINPTMSTDANGKKWIHYAVSFHSNGNEPGYPTIEFYVDTKIDAECKYPADVMLQADGFWVNQEDVSMDLTENGDLADNCDCKFFADANRENQIQSHNIVNMGEMLYGEVSCDTMYGLSYKLTGVEVSDPNDTNNVYDVVANAATVSYSVSPSNSVAATGSDILFQYLSFGFETYGTPNGNQNEINVQCSVELQLS